MITILAAIFVLGVLVFIHETGHFLAAKLFRIRVDRFSIGYPPRLIGKKIGDTDYCISAIPFGGYVKIAGMVDESLDKKILEEEPKPWEFRSKPWIQKVAVVIAGSFMNILFAFAVFVGATMIYGMAEQVPGTHVGSLMEGRPAEEAGMLPGDRIISVDGKEVASWEDMTEIIHGAPGRPLTVSWMRNDTVFSAELTPVLEKIVDGGDVREVGLIGIAPKFEVRPVGLGRAILGGGVTAYGITRLVIVSLIRLIRGRESVRSLAGPLGISRMAGESARSGWGTLIGFMALLSLNLGILNLLPIPVLDGGHLMFLSVEGIIRRPIPLKLKLIIQQVGMFLIFGLMLFAIYNDVIRMINK